MAATITQNSKPLRPRSLDTSGNNNHGTAYTGQALEFDGVADYISADVLDIDIATENWTIACWINITAYASNSSYINVWGNAKDGSNRIGIQAYDQDSDSPKLAFATYNGSSYVSTASDVELDKDTWYYIVATCASNTLKLYINGTLQSGSAVAVSLSNTVKCVVGATASGSNVFNGKISNFQAWDALWSASDVAYAYANPEKLALDNPGTSLTYSDLKLWYPMEDGHRGNQSYLMDGANTGKHVIGTSDEGTFTGSNPSIYPVDANGNYVYKVVGQAYEYTWTITESTSGTGVKVFPESSTYVNAVGTYTETWVATADDRLRLYVHGFVGKISNISVSAVNLKNHGTSVFYGDDLLLKGNPIDDNGDWTAGSNWAADASNEKLTASGTTGTIRATTTTAFANGDNVSVTFTVANYSAGSVRMIVGGSNNGITRDANGTYTEEVTPVSSMAGSYIYFDGVDSFTGEITDITVKEVGFATGWTDADAQPTIPQLGFQSYNQLAWFDGTADYVDLGISANADLGLTTSFTVSCWAIASNSTIGYLWNLYQDTANAIGIKMHKTVIQIYDDMTSNDTPVYNTAIAGDVWHHIVLSVDDSDMTLYVDGVSIGTGTDMTESLDQATYDLYIGSRQDTPTITFAGCVTEWSIFNSALTLAKVQELYNNGEALDALTHSSVANLVGYWRNEGAATWTDLSTNSNNGTPTSVSEHLILPEGQNSRDTQGFLMSRNRVGLNLDGTGYAKGALTTDLTTAATWGLWMNQEILDVNASVLGKGTSGSNNISFYTWTDGYFYFDMRTGSTIYGRFDYSSVISPQTWHYLTVVFDGSLADNATRLKVYVDGVAQTLTFSGTVPTSLLTNDDLQYIGNGYFDYPFKGQLDDLAIYNKALSATEIARNYKAGKRRHRS